MSEVKEASGIIENKPHYQTKEYRKMKSREWRIKNPEKNKQYFKDYHKKRYLNPKEKEKMIKELLRHWLFSYETYLLNDLEQEVGALRNDFQNLEKLFHTQREHFENEISVLKDEIRN